ncbi:MAG: SdpI family protein [Candidatus Pacebacteria bacterium]|nr:SdpI family protein [Candidatus Paceibacterota bacterium]
MKQTKIIIFLIIILSFAVAFYFYPQMPERAASHWNEKGQVDGYISKFWAAFLMPIISLLVALLFLFIPKIDPFKENIKKFKGYFDGFIIILLLFLLYIYLLTIFWNLGFRFNMTYLMIPSLAVLLYYAGILVEKAKRNWFIGIRTPWTLSSEQVWDKTHKIGGRLFKISAVIALLGIFFVEYAFYFVMIPVICFVVFVFFYSYFEYQKEIANNKNIK